MRQPKNPTPFRGGSVNKGTAKGQSTTAKKIHSLKTLLLSYQKTIKSRKRQNDIDYVFKQHIRENDEALYWKAVKAVEKAVLEGKIRQ